MLDLIVFYLNLCPLCLNKSHLFEPIFKAYVSFPCFSSGELDALVRNSQGFDCMKFYIINETYYVLFPMWILAVQSIFRLFLDFSSK